MANSNIPFKCPTMTGAGHGAGRAVAHMFVRGQAAKNSNGQFYTDGTTIWSYGPHWPIATRLKDGRVLLNEGGSSRTTAKHTSWVRQALRSAGIEISTVNREADFWPRSSEPNTAILAG